MPNVYHPYLKEKSRGINLDLNCISLNNQSEKIDLIKLVQNWVQQLHYLVS